MDIEFVQELAHELKSPLSMNSRLVWIIVIMKFSVKVRTQVVEG